VPEIVLTTDKTLMSEYRNIPLADFFGCAPTERVPERLFDFIAAPLPTRDGVAIYAPYGLRKLEADLLKGFPPKDVVVTDPDHLAGIVDESTRVIGISTMDPLGLGPVTMMFTYGGQYTSYTKKRFLELVGLADEVRKKKAPRAKIAVGGPGAWQLDVRRSVLDGLPIDNLVQGELDHVAVDVFRAIESGSLERNHKVKGWPSVDQIPPIVNPAMNGMVEVMRGCGRGCQFCAPNVRTARYMDVEKVLQEVRVNVAGGKPSIWAHSDDIFLYRVEDKRHFYPNTDAIVDLFSAIMGTRGVTHSNPTHGTIAPVIADEDLLPRLSPILKAGPENWIGIQPGLETASGDLLAKYMRNKMLPFTPSEWEKVVLEGTKAFNQNYWFPAYTLIMGLPGETEDDVWATVRLIDTMEKWLGEKLGSRAHFVSVPLSFVPLSVLSREEFFDVGREMTEARFALIYRSWRHTVKEAMYFSQSVKSVPPYLRPVLRFLVSVGPMIILKYIADWGKSMGFDVDKAFNIPGRREANLNSPCLFLLPGSPSLVWSGLAKPVALRGLTGSNPVPGAVSE